jgi:hypothetical protein
MEQLKLELSADSQDAALYKLLHAPIPEKTDTYTPISHKRIIEHTLQVLDNEKFKIKKHIYRSSMDGLIGSGEYHLEFGGDSEMGLMLAWQNSYNKQVSFKYAIGAHVFVCANGMVAGDLAAYRRKHTGTADEDALVHIVDYIKSASSIFTKLVEDRDKLKTYELTLKDVSEMVGRMYLYDQIITSTQLNIMKREMDKSTYDYGVGAMNAWAVYNYATHAFKEDSPRNWIKRHTDLHDFFNREFGFGRGSIPVPTPEDEGPTFDSSGFTIEERFPELLEKEPVKESKPSEADILDMF